MFKVLLSPHCSPMDDVDYFSRLQYPLAVSPKLDGIRCVVKENACKSRKYIDLPSRQVQQIYHNLEHLDGEMIVGNPTAPGVYNLTQSHIMSKDKPADDLRFYIFDFTHPDELHKGFLERLDAATLFIHFLKMENKTGIYTDASIQVLTHKLVHNYAGLIAYEEEQLQLGYEGIMLRDPDGRYKNGRATVNEGIIYKLKRFTDDEGIIIDFVEQMTNTNEDVRDNLGYAKRSTSKDGLVPAGMLGKFIVSYKGEAIEVAPGSFTHADRIRIWHNQSDFIGKIIKFRHFTYGVKDKPRFPRAVGIRDPIDM